MLLISLLLTGNLPPKSITWEHFCFRSFFLPATASFLLLLYLLFPPPQVISRPFQFFLNEFCYVTAVSRFDVFGPKQMCAAKLEPRTCQWRQAGASGCPPLPRAAGSLAAEYLQTACHKQLMPKQAKNTTRTVLLCPTQMEEYFIVIPGKAFQRTHETTIMWSCLSTQNKNKSNLTLKQRTLKMKTLFLNLTKWHQP